MPSTFAPTGKDRRDATLMSFGHLLPAVSPYPKARERWPCGSLLGRFIVALLVPVLSAFPAHGQPVPPGLTRTILTVNETPIEVFLYKPKLYDGGPLLVSFHGLSRNLEPYLDATKMLADRHGMLAVLPLFDRERFPYQRYQALGISRMSRRTTSAPIEIEPRAQWTSALILQLIDAIRTGEGTPDLPYYLIGHSAGGQVLNRFAAFIANGAARIVVANPGSYLRPTREVRFPYGFGDLPPEMSNDAALRRYLAQPMTILLGTADIKSTNLDVRPQAMLQGATRYERGVNVFHMAQELAMKKGWAFNWALVKVPRSGHNVATMYGSPQASAALFHQ